MTKEQYLNKKFQNPLEIIYHYYLEKKDPSKAAIPARQLLTQIQMSGLIHLIVDKVLHHYDCKFEVVSLISKDGTLIKQY